MGIRSRPLPSLRPSSCTLTGKTTRTRRRGGAAALGADNSSAKRLADNRIETSFKRTGKLSERATPRGVCGRSHDDGHLCGDGRQGRETPPWQRSVGPLLQRRKKFPPSHLYRLADTRRRSLKPPYPKVNRSPHRQLSGVRISRWTSLITSVRCSAFKSRLRRRSATPTTSR